MARTNRDDPPGVSYEGNATSGYRIVRHGHGIGFVTRVEHGRGNTQWVARGWHTTDARHHGATRAEAVTALVKQLEDLASSQGESPSGR
jgi:hypothetical protein